MTAAVRMFWRRSQCQGVVTDGGASGLLFAWLQVLFPLGRKPHVMVDCNWYLSGNRFRNTLKRWRVKLAAHSVHRFVVWASHEVADYHEAFGLEKGKLVYVPFHGTLTDYEYEVRRRRLSVCGWRLRPRLSNTSGRGAAHLVCRPGSPRRDRSNYKTSTCRRTFALKEQPWPASARRWRALG